MHELHLHLASREALMTHFDPERIQGYCARCPKYGKWWSCPPFEATPLELQTAWGHALLVLEKVWTPEGADKDGMIQGFHEARRNFRKRLMAAERQEIGARALVAGHCQACDSCCRPAPCRHPEALRHSLEALGFDVTGLTTLAGETIHWPKEGLPPYLMTVGALLCSDEAQAERLAEALRT